MEGAGWTDKMRGPQDPPGQAPWVLPCAAISGLLGLKGNSVVQGHHLGGGEKDHSIRAASESMNFPGEPGPQGEPQGREQSAPAACISHTPKLSTCNSPRL